LKAAAQTKDDVLRHHVVRATVDDNPSTDLWEDAHIIFRVREPELVATYEHELASTVLKSANPYSNPELIENVVRMKLEDREADQMVIRLGGHSVKVREQGERVIKFILWWKDIVAQASSAQPYAALARSGVSTILPVAIT